MPDLEHSPVHHGCLVLWPDSSGVLKLEKRYRAQMQKDPPKVHGGPTHPAPHWPGEAGTGGPAGASIGRSPQRVNGRCDWLAEDGIPSFRCFF